VPGQAIGGRFEIEHLVRLGGASGTCQARDRETGGLVALKVLHLEQRPRELERFLRQAEALRGLRHEGIAGYVAHGQTAPGQAYLATEWHPGEDLAHRLARQPLTVGETLGLARQVASALAAGHGQGVVHGELRPSKILLPEQGVGAVLLGYGITSVNLASRTISSSGELMATLRYLAPEQAWGEELPAASTDIYALGCVLFECLTGRPPIAGLHDTGRLTQLLSEEAPLLRQVREDLPVCLEELLSRMLTRRSSARLANGGELVTALGRVVLSSEEQARVPAPVPQVRLGESDRRLSCVILALPRLPGATGKEEDAAVARIAALTALAPLVSPQGARVQTLPAGGVMVTWPEAGGTATDQAMQAARLALELRQEQGIWTSWSMAVATGPGLGSGMEAGAALQQAMAFLQRAGDRVQTDPPPIWLDELTAGLLDTRFHVRRVDGGLALERERTGAEERRLLLGRQTPYVGRNLELELLETQLRVSIEESAARGVLVIAPSGMGKSRLRQEFLQRVEQREEATEILLGRGDPLRGGAAYGVLGQALRDWCGLGEARGEDPWSRFAMRVGRLVEQAERQRVVEFLGVMCGAPLGEHESPQLRAARQEPRLMNDQVTAAWVQLLRSLCRVHPVLLVLEDLHWSDAATVRLAGVALRELAEERFLVLALARPEVKEVFPRLWAEHPVQEVWMSGLSRRASERLVREMLGERATDEAVGRIVEQAGGNALFLEELIRGAAEGAGGQLPETVLAMLQARLARLAPEGRRLLEVASLMGETFWRGALTRLFGGPEEGGVGHTHLAQSIGVAHVARVAHSPVAPVVPVAPVDRWLRTLVESEVIVPQKTSRFPGETEYAFRHALVRDAAYGLLSEEDRQVGHRLVGGYLERAGERDPVVLAEHYRLGGEYERAADFFAQAAVQAVRASEVAGALVCVERGVACGASGEVLGRLRAVEAQAQLWNWNFQAAYAAGKAGQALLPRGSAGWYQATTVVVVLGGMFEPGVLDDQVRLFVETAPLPGAEGVFAEQSPLVILQICLMGLREPSQRLLVRATELCEALEASEVRQRGLLRSMGFWYHLVFDGDPWLARRSAAQAAEHFASVGDRRYASSSQGYVGWMRGLLGEEQAPAMCRAALAATEALGEAALAGAMQGQLAMMLAEMGEPHLDEALALADLVLRRHPTPFWGVLGAAARASVLAERGDLGAAEEAARHACALAEIVPAGGLLASALLSRVLLAQGRTDEAKGAAEGGLAVLAKLGGMGFMDVKLLLAVAEVRRATGDLEAARESLLEAARRIERRGARIPDVLGRERFWSAVRDNVRVLELLEKM
jgi:tetratricopeptide (TPR) repeat protein